MATPRRLRRSEELSPSSGYRLLLHLAAGGMGSVYIAQARDDGSHVELVAIKRAHPHLADDPEFRKMLIAEASLASRIQHPHVVGVRNASECEGEVFLVMEYVEGGTLNDLIVLGIERQTPLPLPVAIRIIVDAAKGLHAAHTLTDDRGLPLGIVHRDVSPHNVLIGVDGTARIADFGVAKALHHDATATQAGVIKGKAAYMAPEYLLQQKLTIQSDVFSLGIVAWEAITGRRLFRGESDVETMQNVLSNAPVPRLSQHVRVPPPLDDVVARALERNVARRTPSAAAFARDLEQTAIRLGLLATREQVGATLRDRLAAQIEARSRLLSEALAESRGASHDGRGSGDPTRVHGTPANLGAAAPLGREDTPATRTALLVGSEVDTAHATGSSKTLGGASGTLVDGRPPPRRRPWGLALFGLLVLGVAAAGALMVTPGSPLFNPRLLAARLGAGDEMAPRVTDEEPPRSADTDTLEASAAPPQGSASVAAPTNDVEAAVPDPTASGSNVAASASASAPAVRPVAAPRSPGGPAPTIGAGGAPVPSPKPWRPKTNPY